MARELLKRFIPSSSVIKNHPKLQFLKSFLDDPNLFHLNRRSVSVAFFWGLFIAILPIPGQMPLAAAAAFAFRCNLPISVALVWITNPLTMPFFVLITYQVGAFILQTDPILVEPEFTWDWVVNGLLKAWKPLLAGSVVTGLAFGSAAYVFMRVLWRWNIVRAWSIRKKNRAQQ